MVHKLVPGSFTVEKIHKLLASEILNLVCGGSASNPKKNKKLIEKEKSVTVCEVVSSELS